MDCILHVTLLTSVVVIGNYLGIFLDYANPGVKPGHINCDNDLVKKGGYENYQRCGIQQGCGQVVRFLLSSVNT